MSRYRVLLAGATLGVLVTLWGCCTPQRASRFPADEPVVVTADPGQKAGPRVACDLTRKPLDQVPVGTVIADGPPKGWSHLVLFATPTLTAEDLRTAPRTAADYAQMFKFTVLANLGPANEPGKAPYRLDKVARGFAIAIRGKETVVSSSNTLGASMGFFCSRILEENERVLDEDVRQVVRTDHLCIFDARAVMRRDDAHVKMVMRHALVVDPASGKLYTLVWLLTSDFQPAEDALQLLPDGMREQRLLSVKRDEFTLGIPSPEAFALRRIPQGKAVPYDAALKRVAALKTFTEAGVPEVEAVLRAAAIKAAAAK